MSDQPPAQQPQQPLQYPQQQPPPPGQYPPPQYQQQYPQQPPTQVNVQPKKGFPVWLIVLLAVLGLCGIGCVATFVITGLTAQNAVSSLGTAVAKTATAIAVEFPIVDPTIEVPDQPTAQVDDPNSEATAAVEEPAEEQPTTETDAGAAGVGVGASQETAGLRITLNGIRRSQGGQFIKPKAGHEHIILDMTFENIDDKEIAVSNFFANVKDDTGQQYTLSITEDTKSSPDGTIQPGDKNRGEVAFEVPTDAKGLVYIYDPIFGGDPVRFNLDK